MIFINDIAVEAGCALEARAFMEWEPIQIMCEPVAHARAISLRIGSEQLGEPQLAPFDPRWRWTWIPRGLAGTVTGQLCIELQAGDQLQHSFTFELRPRLLDRETWALLIDDLVRLARPLAMRLGGTAFASAVLMPLRSGDRTPLEEALMLLERHSHGVSEVVKQLNQRPASTLQSTHQVQALEEASAFADIQPEHPIQPYQPQTTLPPAVRDLEKRLGGSLPRFVKVPQSQRSYDLPEHRWLAGIVLELQRRARWIRISAEQELVRHKDSTFAQALAELQQRLEQLLTKLRSLQATPVLAGLPPRSTPPTSSQRLVRDHRYRPLRRIWRELRDTPWLTLYVPGIGLPLAALPALYEQWCVLQIIKLLLELPGRIIEQHVLLEASTDDRWNLELVRDHPLLIMQLNQLKIVVRYQPRYTDVPDTAGIVSLDGYVRIPDLVLECHSKTGVHLLVLDAKYQRANDGRVPQRALDDAYAYQGSLGTAEQSRVQQAIVIYPGSGPAALFGTVGAIPAQPGATQALLHWLQQHLQGAEHANL